MISKITDERPMLMVLPLLPVFMWVWRHRGFGVAVFGGTLLSGSAFSRQPVNEGFR
jgi:hypothetical protein